MNTDILFNKNMDLYKFRNWIDVNKIDWNILSCNVNAINILEKIKIRLIG